MEGSGQWQRKHEAWTSQFRKSGLSLGKQQSGTGKCVKWPRAEAVSLRNGGGDRHCVTKELGAETWVLKDWTLVFVL